MKAWLFGGLPILLGLATSPAQGGEKMIWPDLPKTAFTAGRVASVEDAKQGNAVFSMDGKSGGALPLSIPQYAWWTDETGAKHPMVLVQAELAPDGTKVVGLRDFAGQETVATLAEIQLLGTKKLN